MSKGRTTKKGWTRIGTVCVDTGTLLLSDPGYVEDRWVRGTEPPGHPPLTLTQNGRLVYPKLAGQSWRWPFPWGNYDDESPLFGKSVSQLLEKRLLVRTSPDPTGEFSLNGACLAVQEDNWGGLIAENGSPIGLVLTTGYGDGAYPVEARLENGRVAEVRIRFMEA